MVTYSISSVHLGDKQTNVMGQKHCLRNPNISIKIMYPAPEKVTNSASQPRYRAPSLHPNNFSRRQNMPALRKSLLLSHCFSSDSNFLENGALDTLHSILWQLPYQALCSRRQNNFFKEPALHKYYN